MPLITPDQPGYSSSEVASRKQGLHCKDPKRVLVANGLLPPIDYFVGPTRNVSDREGSLTASTGVRQRVLAIVKRGCCAAGNPGAARVFPPCGTLRRCVFFAASPDRNGPKSKTSEQRKSNHESLSPKDVVSAPYNLVGCTCTRQRLHNILQTIKNCREFGKVSFLAWSKKKKTSTTFLSFGGEVQKFFFRPLGFCLRSLGLMEEARRVNGKEKMKKEDDGKKCKQRIRTNPMIAMALIIPSSTTPN